MTSVGAELFGGLKVPPSWAPIRGLMMTWALGENQARPHSAAVRKGRASQLGRLTAVGDRTSGAMIVAMRAALLSENAEPFAHGGPRLDPQLSLLEARVLGVFVEKELTVPDTYPLSSNALTAGCNQRNNRNPVLNAAEIDVQAAIERLKALSMAVESSGTRVMRYSQNVGRALRVPSQAVALLAALWLRGPQTAAELRASTERLHPFADVGSVEAFLQELAERSPESGGPLVRLLPRAAGARESRWSDLVCAAAHAVNMTPCGEQEVGGSSVPEWRVEIERLRAELQALRERVRHLEHQGQLG